MAEVSRVAEAFPVEEEAFPGVAEASQEAVAVTVSKGKKAENCINSNILYLLTLFGPHLVACFRSKINLFSNLRLLTI